MGGKPVEHRLLQKCQGMLGTGRVNVCVILPNERSYLGGRKEQYLCCQNAEGAHLEAYKATSFPIQGRVMQEESYPTDPLMTQEEQAFPAQQA